MGLEKLFSDFKRNFKKVIALLSLTAFLSCSFPSPDPPKPINILTPETKIELKYDYTTTVTTLASEYIDASAGGEVEVNNLESLLNNAKLIIPEGALESDTNISIGEVNNPPALPLGLNYVGSPVNLEPDGMEFNDLLTIHIPYNESSLSDAGISDDSGLGLYCYDKLSGNWAEASVISVDTGNNIVTAELNHFSYYAITCLNGMPPEDLGRPQPGDLLYTLGAFWDEGNLQLRNNWMPGHVGIYVGEKQYNGGLASDDVRKFGKYNVIEARGRGVQFSYYDVPNVTETFEDFLKSFGGENVFMGAREPKNFTLTQKQREDIVAYVEAQIGKPYAWAQTIGVFFGMLRGSLVKGPTFFNCVGLAEKAYEIVGVNNGEGLVSWWNEEMGNEIEGLLVGVLTPAEQYNATKPATGSNKIPILSFTGDYSDSQIAVMNEDGSGIQEITSGPLIKNYPRLSPNRDKIIFELITKDEHSNDIPTFYTMNLDGSGLTELVGTSESTQPAWSSKNYIAYVPRYGLTNIYLFDISDPSIKQKLTDSYAAEQTPSFSSDGNYIVYNYSSRHINQGDFTSGTLTTIISGDDNTSNKEPEFSPDGNKIAFTSNMEEYDNWDIYMYDVSSKNIERLTYRNSNDWSPHFSKDGSKIFFVVTDGEDSQIYFMNQDGSNQKQLTFGPENHSFGDYQ